MLAAAPVSADWLVELPDSTAGLEIVDTEVDTNGDLIVLGEFSGTVDFDPGAGQHQLTSTFSSDMFVAKYDTTGALVNAVDVGDFQISQYPSHRRVTVDGTGDVYLTAGYEGEAELLGGFVLPAPQTGDDAVLFAKLDGSLQTVEWATHFTLTGWGPYGQGEIDVADIDVDFGGNAVYIGGTMGGEGDLGDIHVKTAWDGFTARMDGSTGAFEWVNAYSDKKGVSEVAVDPADPNAISIVRGWDVSKNYEILQRLNASGDILWETTFPEWPDTIRWSQLEAQSGGIYLAGWLQGSATIGQSVFQSAGGLDVLVARFDAATGDVVWVSQAGGAQDDSARELAVDADGNLFLAGTFRRIAQFGTDTLASSDTSDTFLSQIDAADGTFIQNWLFSSASVGELAAVAGSAYATGSFDAATAYIPTGATPTSSSGNFNYLMRLVEATDPTVPRINGFVATPDPVAQGDPLSLSVVGMHDPDLRVDAVDFYHDVDGDRRLDVAVDTLLGSDADGSDGWEISVPTSGLPLGDAQFLARATYDSGSVTQALSTTALIQTAALTYVSSDVGQKIRDRKTVTSSLNVPDSFSITDADVTLTITHTADTDLDVYLIHPDGTRVELFTDVGGVSDNFIDTILDDQADFSITSGDAPFTGRYRPEGLLSALNGKDAAGVWTLEITDDERRDTGTLDAWALALAPQSPPTPTLSIDDVSVSEGDSGTTNAQFTVTRSGDLTQTVTVDYATSDGTAMSGSDYVAQGATTLTFDPGVSSLPVAVAVNGDTAEEPDETFFINLSNAGGATISDAQGMATILDDDGATELGELYIYDIRFESKRGGKDFRAVAEIRSNVDDAPVAGVTLKIDFAGVTYTLETDENGVARTSWERDLADGNYYADAYDLALQDFVWNPFALDLEDDSDGDGKADDLLTV